MKKNKEIIHQFKNHLERLGFSKTSVSMLPSCVNGFFEYSKKSIQKVVSEDILKFYNYLNERPNKKRAGGLSERYINHHIYALKVFFAWQQELSIIEECPISNLSFPTPKNLPREILTTAEIKQIYKCCETLKEKAILSIFYGCGLRRSEGEDLDLKDIHFKSGILYVRKGKNSKRRAVPMSKRVAQDLKNYWYQERKNQTKEDAFITNILGKRTKGNYYNKVLKALLEKANVKKQITLHCLRHSIATHLLESGLSVEYVRDFLGHKHLESTQIYTRINKKQLLDL